MIILILPIAVFLGWIQGMQGKDLATFVGAMAIVYYIGRIIANVIFDADREAAYKANTYRHFRRPSLRMMAENGKIKIAEISDTRDHSQRCQDSLREWHQEEKFIRWNSWRYGLNIIIISILMDKML